MLAAQGDDVALAHERLSACVDVDMHAEFFALADNGIDVLEREVELVAVVCRPTAQAVQVAGARGVEEDGPGDVAAILGARPLLLSPGKKVRVYHESLKQPANHLRIEVGNFEKQLVPVGLVLYRVGECLALRGEDACRGVFVHGFHGFGHVSLGIIQKIVNRGIERGAFDGACAVHGVLLNNQV